METFTAQTPEGPREVEVHHNFFVGKREYVVHLALSKYLSGIYTVSHRKSGFRVGGFESNPLEAETAGRLVLAKVTEQQMQRALRRARRRLATPHA